MRGWGEGKGEGKGGWEKVRSKSDASIACVIDDVASHWICMGHRYTKLACGTKACRGRVPSPSLLHPLPPCICNVKGCDAAQEKEKREVREQSRLAIRAQKAEWAARNKEAWSKGESHPAGVSPIVLLSLHARSIRHVQHTFLRGQTVMCSRRNVYHLAAAMSLVALLGRQDLVIILYLNGGPKLPHSI